MVFFNRIKFVSYFAVLFLVYSSYGGVRNTVGCKFMEIEQLVCPDCTAPYLVTCDGLVGFVSRNARVQYSYYGRFDRIYVHESIDKAYNNDASTHRSRDNFHLTYFRMTKKTPLYKTPLGQTVTAVLGEGEVRAGANRPCQYTAPSTPNRVIKYIGELPLTLCYGHAVCDVDLEGFGLAEARTELFPVACTANVHGECPAAGECIEDAAVEFSEVASEREKNESELILNQRLEKMVMDAIRESADEFKDESWDKIQKRIDEEIKIQTARQRAVEAWMVAQQESMEHYEAVKERQRESVEKRQRARHGGR